MFFTNDKGDKMRILAGWAKVDCSTTEEASKYAGSIKKAGGSAHVQYNNRNGRFVVYVKQHANRRTKQGRH